MFRLDFSVTALKSYSYRQAFMAISIKSSISYRCISVYFGNEIINFKTAYNSSMFSLPLQKEDLGVALHYNARSASTFTTHVKH